MLRQKGFTLAELMVALAVTGITLSVGVPGFTDFVANQTQTATTNDLVLAMTLARSEAIKQNRFVTVCESADGLQCGTTGNWNDGWIVFANTSQVNAGTVDATEVVLRIFESGRRDRKIVADAAAAANFVAFRPSGTVTVSATWLVCDHRGKHFAKSVFVDRAGRARSVDPDPQAAETCS